MLPDDKPIVENITVDNAHDESARLNAEYSRIRLQLEALLSQPVKDMPQVDALVHQLEQLQLRFKRDHGLEGNNPNE